MKRSLLVVLLFAAPILAQSPATDQAAQARAAAGCGPSETHFEVTTDKNQHPLPQPETGKALVYIFRVEKRTPDVHYFGKETMLAGIDGTWIGANRDDNSFLFLPLDPGSHHLCVNFDSKLKKFSRIGTATSFSAEAGKVYYFRAEIDFRMDHEFAAKLESIDPAEGQLLVASSSLSISHPKK